MMQPPDTRNQITNVAILVCFALEAEATPFRKISADKPAVSLLVTGIGRGNAEKSVREFLAAHSPELVLTCGFAGGLNPDLQLGDVLFEIGNWKSDIRNQLVAAGAKPAKFFCADRIAVTVAEKAEMHAETGADAVEMESGAIQAVCRGHGIPCAVVRVISDTAREDLPLDFNLVARPDRGLDCGRLLLAIAKSPRTLGALVAFRKRIKFAAIRLAEVLARIISP
jgi:adenosylhomocysteine nucleosidase